MSRVGKRPLLLVLAGTVGGGVGSAIGALTGDVVAGLLAAGRLGDRGSGFLLVSLGVLLGGGIGAAMAVAATRAILRQPSE